MTQNARLRRSVELAFLALVISTFVALWVLGLLAFAFAGDLPDAAKTPGAIDPTLTEARLCAKGFSTRTVRNVPSEEKKSVYASYGLAIGKKPCPCEVDHLISLEIGGSNEQRNLWPQSYVTMPWNAHVKDRLENKLHALVCSKTIALEEAQHEIATDWIAAYHKYMPRGKVK
jgi:hypothetical protein